MLGGPTNQQGGETLRRRVVPSASAIDFHNSTFSNEYLHGDELDTTTLVSLPTMSDKEKEVVDNARFRKEQKKGALLFFFLLLFAFGVPGYIIYRNTPFFYFQNIRCRLTDRFFFSDRYAVASEEAYQSFFHNPPLFGSEEYQRAMWWGTYDPSKLFALTTAPLLPSFASVERNASTVDAFPSGGSVTRENATPDTPHAVTVGIAWYDDAGLFPLRHTTALLHNRVVSLPSNKEDRDVDAVRVEWVVHDGHHYGRLRIEDYPLQLKLEIEFLKTAPYGDGWHARIHGTLEPSETRSGLAGGIHFVLYLLNDDENESVTVAPPPATASMGGKTAFRPTLHTRMWNYRGEKAPITLHVMDEHSPFSALQPWRVMLLQTGGRDSGDAARSPFALQQEDTFGGRVQERLSTQGKTRKGVNSSLQDFYANTPVDLRALTCASSSFSSSSASAADDSASSGFCVLHSEDGSAFRLPPPVRDTDPHEGTHRNMVVLKRQYNSDFRLELSLTSSLGASPTGSREAGEMEGMDVAYTPLSGCQATNAFRRRQKHIAEHQYKIFRPWTNFEKVDSKPKDEERPKRGTRQGPHGASGKLYERIASATLAELLGSLSYTQGRYLVRERKRDEKEKDGNPASSSPPPLSPSGATTNGSSIPPMSSSIAVAPFTAATFSFVGSRTDEAFGRLDISGWHLLLLVRYNKELVKSLLYSWIVQSQDARSGFIPSRTGFHAEARSLMPREFRVEEEDASLPPTILLGLQELLREMDRKRERVEEGRKTTPRTKGKARNSDAYLAKEFLADRQFLQQLLPSLQRWRQWWHRTQCGGVTDALARACAVVGNATSAARRPLEEWPSKPTGNPADQLAYRWRARSGPFSLPSSGLEDYPRPVCAGHEHRELHVDVFSWIALLSRLISTIEVHFLGVEESVRVDWEAHLEALHWDEGHQQYSDRIGCPASGAPHRANASWSAAGVHYSGSTPFSDYVGVVNVLPVALGIPRRSLSHVRHTMHLARRSLTSSSDLAMQSLSFASIRQMREDRLQHHNSYTGPIWPQHNLLYAYTLKTIYGQMSSDASHARTHSSTLSSSETSDNDPPSANHAASEERERNLFGQEGVNSGMELLLRRDALAEYHRIRKSLLPPLFHLTRWWECFSPVDGSGLGGKTYIGSRALLLSLLYDFE